jgi:hypothetical protein
MRRRNDRGSATARFPQRQVHLDDAVPVRRAQLVRRPPNANTALISGTELFGGTFCDLFRIANACGVKVDDLPRNDLRSGHCGRQGSTPVS